MSHARHADGVTGSPIVEKLIGNQRGIEYNEVRRIPRMKKLKSFFAPLISVNSDDKAEAYKQEALPYLDDIFRVAARMVGNRTEAEDVVQEVFMQAWKSFHRFELGTNCRAWLFRILFHKLNHHRRKSLRWKVFKNDEANLEQLPDYQPAFSEHLSDKEILLALERLPSFYREVVLLTDVQEFSYKETAEILRIPLGTVMSRLSRGRKLLRHDLAGVAAAYGILEV